MRSNYVVVSLAFFSIIYLFYFLFFGSTNWYRHFYPIILAVTVILPYYSDIILAEINKKNIIKLLIIFLFIGGNLIYYNLYTRKNNFEKKLIEQNLIFYHEQISPFIKPDSLLLSQLQITNYLKKSIPLNSQIAGISWWNAPEIEYLSRRKIERDPFPVTIDYVIVHYYGIFLGLNEYQYLPLIKNKTEIYHSEGYSIYKKLKK